MKQFLITNTFNTISIAGIETACITRKEIALLIASLCSSSRSAEKAKPYLIFDSNGHAISMAHTDSTFMDSLRQADLIHADGQSIVSFSKRLKGENIPERSATTDMIHDLPEMLDQPLKHFLLGGRQDIVSKAADLLGKKHKNFIVAGFNHGFFKEVEEAALCEKINESDADILWVGLGKPKEQAFCIRNKSRLRTPVIISCGGCYNYITGDYPRAPEWMQKSGLEWLHRMLTNPRQLFMRYLLTSPHAIYCAFFKRSRS